MITFMLIVVLFFGVKINFALSYSACTMVANINIFRRWRILSVTLKVIGDRFYYYINKGQLKPIKNNAKINSKSNAQCKVVSATKRKYVSMRMPKIVINDATISLDIASEDIIAINSVGAVFLMIASYLKYGEKIVARDLRTHLDIHHDYFDVKAYVGFTIKFGVIKIIYEYLRTLVLNRYYGRKYATQSNRRTHGMHA